MELFPDCVDITGMLEFFHKQALTILARFLLDAIMGVTTAPIPTGMAKVAHLNGTNPAPKCFSYAVMLWEKRTLYFVISKVAIVQGQYLS